MRCQRSLEDTGWIEFLELQREAFRQYLARYVDALHRARPGYQITSNWMYSTFAPERPTLPLDFLSGDVTGRAAVRKARLEARYLSRCGKPWDLMSWGFETDAKFGHSSEQAGRGAGAGSRGHIGAGRRLSGLLRSHPGGLDR